MPSINKSDSTIELCHLGNKYWYLMGKKVISSEQAYNHLKMFKSSANELRLCKKYKRWRIPILVVGETALVVGSVLAIGAHNIIPPALTVFGIIGAQTGITAIFYKVQAKSIEHINKSVDLYNQEIIKQNNPR